MKTYRQREKQGGKIQESTKGPDESKIKVNGVCVCGERLGVIVDLCVQKLHFVLFTLMTSLPLSQALLERTGYTLDVTTGQRKYGGPPPETVFSGTQPGIGTEVKPWLETRHQKQTSFNCV